MSYLFEHRDEPIWEPSVDVARLLLAATSHLEVRLGIKSGLTESMSDTIDIDFVPVSQALEADRERAGGRESSHRLGHERGYHSEIPGPNAAQPVRLRSSMSWAIQGSRDICSPSAPSIFSS
jgi:Family of unknown function (DUF6086)